MRTRLTKSERRADILQKALQLFAERGFSDTEMEDIRLACGISRGGLYHHFSNKRAILDALVEAEVSELAEALNNDDKSPIHTLLLAGSSHLDGAVGVLSALRTSREKLDYLSALDQAFTAILREPLLARLSETVGEGSDPEHVTELILIVNAHINRREILGQWSSADAAGFAATALKALVPLLRSHTDLGHLISDLQQKAAAS